MSEYEYYEFRAIDRPLSKSEMGKLREISTRAEISPTRLTNFYTFGNFKGNPEKLVEQYFDVFFYFANWGTRRLMLRVPRGAFDLKTLKPYLDGESFNAWETKTHLILEFCIRDESGDWVDESDESLLDELLPARDLLVEGDLRLPYLGWLLGVQMQYVDEENRGPPVPAGLKELPDAIQAFADFLLLDNDVLTAAAEASEPLIEREIASSDLQSWLAKLPAAEKDAMLLDVMESGRNLSRELRARYRLESRTKAPHKSTPVRSARSVGELLKKAEAIAEEREAEEARKKAAAAERTRRKKAEERAKYLDDLASKTEKAWNDIERLIESKQANKYKEAVEILADLSALAEDARLPGFAIRLEGIRTRHQKKSNLISLLTKRGL